MSDQRAEYLASASTPAPEDQERLDEIRAVLSDESTWSEPPPEVAEGVLAAIAGEAADTQDPSGRWWWIGAAAAIIVVIAIAGVTGVFSPTADQQTVAMEGTELEPTASGSASIEATDVGWWIRLDLDDLPAAGEGTYYEGWVWNDEGEGVSIGTFHLRGGDRPVVLWSGVDPADYPSIWVTLESEDGDPSASDRIVVWGRGAES